MTNSDSLQRSSGNERYAPVRVAGRLRTEVAALHSRRDWPADAARLGVGWHADRSDGELVAAVAPAARRRAPGLKRCAP
jgi:hypothetical protein